MLQEDYTARGTRASRHALAVILAAMVVAAPVGAVEQSDAPGRLVAVASHSLHIHCVGEGEPTVVFESGLGGTSFDWVKVQPAIATTTRACTYDRAGYGFSESGPEPRTAEVAAEELRTLLVRAGVPGPFLLVGHSLGGLNVRLFAHRYPELISGIVLIDATHENQFERMEVVGNARAIAPNRRAFIIANYWEVPTGMPASVRDTVQSLTLLPRAVRSLYLELQSMRESAASLKRAAVRFPNVPVRVIIRGETTGADARYRVWRALQRDLATSAVDGQLVVATDAGHHVHLDTPEVVIEAIEALVEQARRP